MGRMVNNLWDRLRIGKFMQAVSPCAIAYKSVLGPLKSPKFWVNFAAGVADKSCKEGLTKGAGKSILKSLGFPILGYTVIRYVCGPPTTEADFSLSSLLAPLDEEEYNRRLKEDFIRELRWDPHW